MRETSATFKGKRQEFKDATDAFVWLIQCMRSLNRTAYDKYYETYMVLHTHARDALIIARDPEQLFKDEVRSSRMLGDGWYVNTCLSNEMKLDFLAKFSGWVKADLKYDRDWSFDPAYPTPELLAVKKRLRDASDTDDLLDEMLKNATK